MNQIYWFICENNKGVKKKKNHLICEIDDFEVDEVRKLIIDLKYSSRICDSAKVAVNLFIEKNVRGLSDRKMEDEFKLGRNCLKNIVACGGFYIAGHDKRLRIK